MNPKTPFYLRITKSGYIWDKRIFWCVMFILILGLGIILHRNNYDLNTHFYFNCTKDLFIGTNNDGLIDLRQCENPVYYAKYQSWFFGKIKPAREACDWCGYKYLPVGEYGTQTPRYFEGFAYLAFSLPLLGICLNHFMHNLGKKFDIGLEQYDQLKKFKEKIQDENN